MISIRDMLKKHYFNQFSILSIMFLMYTFKISKFFLLLLSNFLQVFRSNWDRAWSTAECSMSVPFIINCEHSLPIYYFQICISQQAQRHPIFWDVEKILFGKDLHEFYLVMRLGKPLNEHQHQKIHLRVEEIISWRVHHYFAIMLCT